MKSAYKPELCRGMRGGLASRGGQELTQQGAGRLVLSALVGG